MSFVNKNPKTVPNVNRTIFKNTIFVTLGSLTLKFFSFVYGIFIVRQLGDERFGQYSIVLGFVGLFQIFAELGISQYVMREISRDRSLAPRYFWNLIALRMLLGLVGIGIITAGATVLHYSDAIVFGVFIQTSSFLLAALDAPIKSVFSAHEKLGYVASLAVVGQITVMILGGAFLLSGLGFEMLILANLLSIVPQIILGLWGLRRYNFQLLPIQLNPKEWFSIIRHGLPFGVISLALTIDFSVDTFMLSLWQPDYVVGWYNVAYNLTRSLVFIFSGFMIAIVPSLSKTYVRDEATVQSWYYRAVKFGLFFSVPIAIGGTLLSLQLVHFLYNETFTPVADSLRIIIWDIPFLVFAGLGGQMTTIITAERTAARVYAISAVFNILANLFAIPNFSYLGASLVTVLTDILVAIQFYILLRARLKLPNILPLVVRVLLAASVMALAVWAAQSIHVLFAIAIGGAVYMIVILLVRFFDQTEWGMLQKAIGKLRREASNRLS